MREVPERAVQPEGQDDVANLLARCAQGDQVAFTTLYDAIAGRVYGLALRVLRDPVQAEEVAHEAFIDIWRSAKRFDSTRGGTGQAWIFTIVHRKAVDRVRSATAATKRDARYHHMTQTVEYDSTSDQALLRVEAERVRAAIMRLTPVQRNTVELAYFGGLTHSEVAAALQIPLGTVKTRIRDSLIRLREEWSAAA